MFLNVECMFNSCVEYVVVVSGRNWEISIYTSLSCGNRSLQTLPAFKQVWVAKSTIRTATWSGNTNICYKTSGVLMIQFLPYHPTAFRDELLPYDLRNEEWLEHIQLSSEFYCLNTMWITCVLFVHSMNTLLHSPKWTFSSCLTTCSLVGCYPFCLDVNSSYRVVSYSVARRLTLEKKNNVTIWMSRGVCMRTYTQPVYS